VGPGPEESDPGLGGGDVRARLIEALILRLDPRRGKSGSAG
jgi:hypothetical protein